MENKELRYFQELRATTESRKIEGYALVFNQESQDLGGFTEIIEPSALDESILSVSDVFALHNHNTEQVLARNQYNKPNQTLSLKIDERGLHYEFEAPNTTYGNDTLEHIRLGNISQSSFAFVVDKDEWEKRENGKYLRKIKRFKQLFDVSPVYQPAFLQTTVAVRSLENFKNSELLAVDNEAEKQEIKEYIKNIQSEIQTIIKS